MNQSQLTKYIELSSIPLRRIDASYMPDGIASACIFHYEGKRLLLTVHHATGDMANWGIQVRFEPGKGTAIQPLGSMNFLRSFNIYNNLTRDIDFAYVEIAKNLAITSQTIDPKSNAIICEINRHDSKIDFNLAPSKNESYGFSGQVMPSVENNKLITEVRTYMDLKYVGDEDDYYVFELPFKHPGHEHFKGCSGAPIIDTEGNVVALICKGDIQTKKIYGISLKRYEIAINATYGKLSEIE